MNSEPSVLLIGTFIVIGDKAATTVSGGLYWRAGVCLALILLYLWARNSAK
jgi:hypothetical protein